MHRRRSFLWPCSTSCASLLICCPWSSAAWCRYYSFSLSFVFKKRWRWTLKYLRMWQSCHISKVFWPLVSGSRRIARLTRKSRNLLSDFNFFMTMKCIASIRPVCLWSVCVCFCPMRSWMKTMWSGQPSLHVSRVIHKRFKSGIKQMYHILWRAFFSMLCMFDTQSIPIPKSFHRQT